MKTALLIERFDVKRGGAEVYAAGLAEGLVRAGHSVEVYCMEGGAPPNGVTVREVSVTTRTRAGGIVGFARACAEAAERGKYDAVMGVGRTLGQDVLMPPGGMVSGARTGTLRSITSPAELIGRRIGWMIGPAARATKAIEREQFDPKGKTHFIINSEMVLADLRRDYEIEERRVHLMYTGVDTKRFSPETCAVLREEARREFGVTEGETAFVFVGNNFRLKGLETLLEAGAKLAHEGEKGFRILVAGAGKREVYERKAQRLGLEGRVKFLGLVEDTTRVYAAGDAMVHPTFYDPFSNVVLEAWACGVPAITTEFNGAAELMTGKLKDWVLDDPTSAQKLAQMMRRLMNAETHAGLSVRFRELAEKHDTMTHCAQVISLFEQVRREKLSR